MAFCPFCEKLETEYKFDSLPNEGFCKCNLSEGRAKAALKQAEINTKEIKEIKNYFIATLKANEGKFINSELISFFEKEVTDLLEKK